MTTYLVSGSAGFIGSRVAELLLEAGHRVIGLDNLSDAYAVQLKEWRLTQLQRSPNFTFIAHDIRQREGLDAIFEREPIGAVLNLAARAGVRYSVQNPWIYYETNVIGTLNLLDACRNHGVGKFVLASTSSLYGNGNPTPFHEDQNTDRPLSPYAASKKAAESLCATYQHLHGIDVSVVRYFTVYGPAGRPDMTPFRFVQRISEGWPITVYGDGQQSRDFTYIDDIARGTIAALRPLGYEIINLGSDTPLPLRELILTIENLLDTEAQIDFQPAHAADMPHTWADVNKAERLLDWRPQVGFREGVQALVDWYRTHREWASQINTLD